MAILRLIRRRPLETSSRFSGEVRRGGSTGALGGAGMRLFPEVHAALTWAPDPSETRGMLRKTHLWISICALAWSSLAGGAEIEWTVLAELPSGEGGEAHPGLAGPFAGVHQDALVIAGGANFPGEPRWETGKVWHRDIYVLEKRGEEAFTWKAGGRLPRPLAYGASVSTPEGVVCLGGDDGETISAEVFMLAWEPAAGRVVSSVYPELPAPCAYGQAVLVGNTIYLAGGQGGKELASAEKNFWALDLSRKDTEAFAWQVLEAWPGPERAFNLTAAQHNGYDDCVYVMSGRRQLGDEVRFLEDVWEYNTSTKTWRARPSLPRPAMAGTAMGYGQSHVFVLGGADGSLWGQEDVLRDRHPGFPKEALLYHTITGTWTSAGALPANHVTTVAVAWGDSIVIPSGEIRPRVRSATIWQAIPLAGGRSFGAFNYAVLVVYLLLMLAVGFYFAKKNKNTDDYFRGGKQMAWWAAGCSIFATMLSSLTYTGLPSKAFAQDWVYAVGNMMIPVAAIVAVYLALPFYRRIDATSAYEYLEKRFNRAVRVIGSVFFTLFHVFRMAVVMSLTGLALAVATPLTPAHSVILMGVLSIIYCAMGGIEAVIWTDTIQTVVLLGGAILVFVMLLGGIDGGFSGFVTTANEAGKFRVAHFHWDITSAQIALWIIVIGALGQHTSSYTADQAVVQRYMTTPTEKLAARSIWTNAVLSVFATFLFFGLGSALFAFYQAHPGKLDPTISTDQILPLFITQEMPSGLAGLIVAGIFAAAQSTVSTSMNSTATTVVTDFLRPLKVCQDEIGYLKAARFLTVVLGMLGTAIGVIFVDPEIRSLFDTFIKVIGLFMGVLGGFFVLGVMTRRANSSGALAGGLTGAVVMFCLWRFTAVNGYLYTVTGMVTCVGIGYLGSLALPGRSQVEGLTIHSLARTGNH